MMILISPILIFGVLLGVPYYFVYQKLIKGKPSELLKSIIWILFLASVSGYITLWFVTLPLRYL